MMIFGILMMFVVLAVLLCMGYPIALTLGAVALLFGSIFLDLGFFTLLPLRIWGIMGNFTLLAVPLFIFMGVMLDRAGIAEQLLEMIGKCFGHQRGGLALSVIIVGALLAATTGVVGATVVTMGVIALPVMLKHRYSPALASGVVASSGTLGQIIPPSVILILLGDVMGVPVGRLFMGAVIPGLLLVGSFCLYTLLLCRLQPELAPPLPKAHLDLPLRTILFTVLPPVLLIGTVLGSIFFGVASPSESAALGALGALLLAVVHKKATLKNLQQAMQSTAMLTSMVFFILIGATAFGLVFRGMGGDKLLLALMTAIPGDMLGFMLISMLLIFFLGFFLDFLQICFIVVPILSPIASSMGVDLLWFAILIAVNLQTAFLTPPFGFSLFYLKAVAPKTVKIQDIYRGVVPFVLLQLAIIVLLICFPQIISWLPDKMDAFHGLS